MANRAHGRPRSAAVQYALGCQRQDEASLRASEILYGQSEVQQLRGACERCGGTAQQPGGCRWSHPRCTPVTQGKAPFAT
jgi:hypothetical protein